MTRALSSPRRHEDILTHRTASRRIGEVECHSDSCFDIDDNSKQKGSQYFVSPKGTSRTAVSPNGQQPQAFFPTSSSQPHKRRRRIKHGKTRNNLPRNLSILVFLLVILGFFFWKSWFLAALIHTDVTPNFEQFSLTGSGSCGNELSAGDVSFTLVTQVSADRLWMMEHQCQRWRVENSTYSQQHPISIAVFTNDTEVQVLQQLKDFGCDLELVSAQILSAKLYPPDDYPVNELRNLALRATKTSHAVLVDIDFWISQDLSQILQRSEVTDLLTSDPLATLVIPAFMLHRQCHEWRECQENNVPEMPLDLQDLKQQILDHKVTRFDPTNRGGHGSTKYKEWFKQNYENGDTLLEIDCFLSNRYEPYLVFRLCHDLPPFQEAFAGYGKNKMTWVMQLRRMGYTFWQLGKGAYVIHYPHLDSPSRLAWNNAPEKRNNPSSPIQWQAFKRGRMDQLFLQFREWLSLEVPDRTRTPFCQEKLDDDARLWYDRKALNSTG